MFFVCSILLIIAFLLIPRRMVKDNLVTAIPQMCMLYLAYLCSVSSIMSILKIDVNSRTISWINILALICIVVWLLKNKNIQKYYLDFYDIVFCFLLFVGTLAIWIKRFSTDFNIVFATSDPGTHLKNAMDIVNFEKVEGLYVGALEMGLVIDSLKNQLSFDECYKVLLIFCGINLLFAGLIMYSCIRRMCENSKIVAFAFTIIYVLGYPLNDFIFGFVYLQLTISFICLLIILVYDYCDTCCSSKVNKWFISMTCLTVGIGYTLFVPWVFLATLVCITTKFGRKFFCVDWIVDCLCMFLYPSFVTLWETVFRSKTIMGALAWEGAIYRNLYMDFILLMIPVLYYYFERIKTKVKINLPEIMLIVSLVYYLIIGYRMVNGLVSTYYYYKLNYLLWMILIVLASMGVTRMLICDKKMFFSYAGVIVILFLIFATKIEYKLREKNELICSVESTSFFNVYEVNHKYIEQETSKLQNGLIEIAAISNQLENQKIVFIGYWLYTYWFEALTNQRFSWEVAHTDNLQELIERFKDGEYGRYAVVMKGMDNIDYSDAYIIDNIVKENEFAYIIDSANNSDTERIEKYIWH